MNGSNPGDDSSDPDENAEQDRDRGDQGGGDDERPHEEPASESGSDSGAPDDEDFGCPDNEDSGAPDDEDFGCPDNEDSGAPDDKDFGDRDDEDAGRPSTSDGSVGIGSDGTAESRSDDRFTAESRSDDRFEADPNDTFEADPRRSAGSRSDGITIEDDGVVRWFLKSDDGTVVFVRDILSSVAIVVVIGLILFGVSGVWPPLVAVESGSMEPNMQRGDLVFVVDDDRFVGDDPVDDTGIVTLENGQESGHEKFGGPGDVIVFRPDGDDHRTPVIHRAHFWVESGENWVDTRADEDIIGDTTCNDVRSCPAPHDGFVTKGDANRGYDQHENEITTVVRPEWVTGKASFRIPWLGHVRLAFDTIFGGMLAPSPVIDAVPGSPIDTVSASVPSDGWTPVGSGLAGAAGLAGAGVGVAMVAGRYRN